MAPPTLAKAIVDQMSRRDGILFVYDDDDDDNFWWSGNSQITRWAVFGGLIFLVILFVTLGYWHARRRIKKGLAPLAYHRWMLGKSRRAQDDLNYGDPTPQYSTYPQDQYGMHAYPPPVYDPNSAPPSYQPPLGATKVDPSQARRESTTPASEREPSPEYTPPPGPPPAVAAQINSTGSSSASNNPYRQ